MRRRREPVQLHCPYTRRNANQSMADIVAKELFGESSDPPTPTPPECCISLSDVRDASRRISGLARRTPVLTSASLDVLCSGSGSVGADHHAVSDAAQHMNASRPRRRIFFKCEALQRTGSFKYRGAQNAILSLLESLPDDEEDEEVNVVAHSSGNHAAAVALAAHVASEMEESGVGNGGVDGAATMREGRRKRRVRATIVMPRNAPRVKVNAVRGFGGEIVFVGNANEDREEKADEIVEERGAHLIHPTENPNVIAGQGTTSLEMVEQVREMLREWAEHDALSHEVGDLDAVIIPVGGGGLAAGNTVLLRGLLGDRVKIILAEPQELDDAKRSFDSGQLLGHRVGNTLDSVADGLRTTLGPNTWPIVRDMADDIITVSEEEILRATKIVWERLKVCIEPSAGVGVAVAMGSEFAQRYRVEDGIVNVGKILCGGNVDVVEVARKMEDMGIDI